MEQQNNKPYIFIITILLLVLVFMGYLLYANKSNSEKTTVTQLEVSESSSYGNNNQTGDLLTSNLNQFGESVPNGEYKGKIGSVLRVDDTYVDDQFFVYVEILEIKGETPINLELAHDAQIKILNSGKQLEQVTLENFRKTMRSDAKSSNGFKRNFLINVKEKLVTSVIEVI